MIFSTVAQNHTRSLKKKKIGCMFLRYILNPSLIQFHMKFFSQAKLLRYHLGWFSFVVLSPGGWTDLLCELLSVACVTFFAEILKTIIIN